MLSMASEYGGMMDMAGVAMIADSMLQDMSVTWTLPSLLFVLSRISIQTKTGRVSKIANMRIFMSAILLWWQDDFFLWNRNKSFKSQFTVNLFFLINLFSFVCNRIFLFYKNKISLELWQFSPQFGLMPKTLLHILKVNCM